MPPAERIATFDNDGTLWSEQPLYFQFAFALDRVKALAPQHPNGRPRSRSSPCSTGDVKGVLGQGEKAMLEIMAATHTGMTTEEFTKTVRDWAATAKHPRFGRLYTEMVFQPMLELLAYLRANGFKTFIVSGGGIEFMRPGRRRSTASRPSRSSAAAASRSSRCADGPVLLKDAEDRVHRRRPGKPVGINRFIGRRPILAFGNSDGDHQMLQWTAAGQGHRFMGIVHHTDAEREWAYDRSRTSASSTRLWTRPWPRAGRSWT